MNQVSNLHQDTAQINAASRFKVLSNFSLILLGIAIPVGILKIFEVGFVMGDAASAPAVATNIPVLTASPLPYLSTILIVVLCGLVISVGLRIAKRYGSSGLFSLATSVGIALYFVYASVSFANTERTLEAQYSQAVATPTPLHFVCQGRQDVVDVEPDGVLRVSTQGIGDVDTADNSFALAVGYAPLSGIYKYALSTCTNSNGKTFLQIYHSRS